jgi:hypothetical protein
LGDLYSDGLIFGGGAYIWNDVSVSTCGGLIHGGGLIFGGAYSRRFTVCHVEGWRLRIILDTIYRLWVVLTARIPGGMVTNTTW